ncbi:MAG: beta-ribofuranosylaminobenzene 5'-phosphate synthase family protein [Halobacteriales archaeon]|nr:beta-ribofuranosylaminobenzene 5'-phosphate synthase family protein [Halobacteriales archaeon]
MRVRVATGGRLHFGFLNLSLAHQRLYGGIGVAVESPEVIVEATPAETVRCEHPDAAPYAKEAAELLGVSGATIDVIETLPRHVGLGSGTQLALAVASAVAAVNEQDADPRRLAPQLGRGGRSGVGVGCFEAGGFVLDAGHPTERFTTDRPVRGSWEVPPVAARHRIPNDWRFLIVLPAADRGRSGEAEDQSMRAIVERADPTIADEISAVVTRRLLPGIAANDRAMFGRAIEAIGRLNGTWYADEQGGVYRPPVGTIVDHLRTEPAITGVGQSSWGPAVYGVTTTEHATAARTAGEDALEAAAVSGNVRIVRPRNRGAEIDRNGT